MARSSPLIAHFSKGELSPLLKGRYDIPGLMSGGCQALTNFIVLPQGPITKRPGTRYVNDCFNHDLAHYLIPFAPNAIDPFMLDVYAGFYRVLNMNGDVVNTGPKAAPWTQAMLGGTSARSRGHNLRSVQAQDLRYFACDGMVPQRLTRIGDESFSLASVNLDTAPLVQNADRTKTAYASAATGNVNLTFSSGFNIPAGTVVRLEPGNLNGNKPWVAGESITTGDRRRADGHIYIASSTGTTGSGRPVHTRGTASDGVVSWDYAHSNEGYVRINSNTSSTVKAGTVIGNDLPLNVVGSSNSTSWWSTSDWHLGDGTLVPPTSVTLFRERLVFARGLTLWFSETDNYESFRYTTFGEILATSAMRLTLAAENASEITWMAPSRWGLIVGTDVGEYIVHPATSDTPFGPGNVTADLFSRVGSRPQEPVLTDNAILFTGRTSKRVHEIKLEPQISPPLDLSALAEHIPGVGVAGMCYQRAPWSIVWSVLSDGTLGGMTYAPDDQVTAWHRHRIGGRSPQSDTQAAVESICAVTAVFGGDVRNDVWMVVRRSVTGFGLRRYIERMTVGYRSGQLAGEAAYLDCSGEYDGRGEVDDPSQTILMPSWLGRDTVQILADGGQHRDVTRTDAGTFSLDAPAVLVRIGYGYSAFLKHMPLDVGGQGAVARAGELLVRVIDTMGGRVGEASSGFRDLDERDYSTPMGSPPPLFTGDRKVSMPLGWTDHLELVVSHELPTPCTILALVPVTESTPR